MAETPVVARTADGGHSLVVFLPSGRRSALAPGERLEDVSVADLEAAAVAMTATESIIRVDGVSWLVQASGPVWSDGAAADATGLVFTALDGSERRLEVADRAPGPMPDHGELVTVLRGVLTADA